MKSITIVADDRVGLLADISYLLGKAKINIESISVDVIGTKAVIALSIKDAEKTRSILENSGYKTTEANVVVIKLPDEPGQLSKITTLLAQQKINIANVHMLSKDEKNTVLGIVVDRPKKASELLKEFLVNREEAQ